MLTASEEHFSQNSVFEKVQLCSTELLTTFYLMQKKHKTMWKPVIFFGDDLENQIVFWSITCSWGLSSIVSFENNLRAEFCLFY